jgi:hypothetical protein
LEIVAKALEREKENGSAKGALYTTTAALKQKKETPPAQDDTLMGQVPKQD